MSCDVNQKDKCIQVTSLLQKVEIHLNLWTLLLYQEIFNFILYLPKTCQHFSFTQPSDIGVEFLCLYLIMPHDISAFDKSNTLCTYETHWPCSPCCDQNKSISFSPLISKDGIFRVKFSNFRSSLHYNDFRMNCRGSVAVRPLVYTVTAFYTA